MKVLIKKTKEIKEVNDSYAVNYLVPNGLALIATEKVLEEESEKKMAKQKTYDEKQKQYEDLAKELEGKKVTIKVIANNDGELFGSVNKQQIKKALGTKEKIGVVLKEPIKRVGEYELVLKIGKNKVKVVLVVKAS